MSIVYSTVANGCHIAQEMGHGDWRLLEREMVDASA